MSLSDRRSFLIFGAAALSGCGFRPLYGGKGAQNPLQGAVLLQEAVTPEDFAYRERLRRRFGQTGDQDEQTSDIAWRLAWRLSFSETRTGISPRSNNTRIQVRAEANALLQPVNGDEERQVTIRLNGGYDATASAYATWSAKQAEYKDLATELAELTASRLLAQSG